MRLTKANSYIDTFSAWIIFKFSSFHAKWEIKRIYKVNNVYIIYICTCNLYGREILNEDSQCDVYEYHHIMQVRKYVYVTTQAEGKDSVKNIKNKWADNKSMINDEGRKIIKYCGCTGEFRSHYVYEYFLMNYW